MRLVVNDLNNPLLAISHLPIIGIHSSANITALFLIQQGKIHHFYSQEREYSRGWEYTRSQDTSDTREEKHPCH